MIAAGAEGVEHSDSVALRGMKWHAIGDYTVPVRVTISLRSPPSNCILVRGFVRAVSGGATPSAGGRCGG